MISAYLLLAGQNFERRFGGVPYNGHQRFTESDLCTKNQHRSSKIADAIVPTDTYIHTYIYIYI